MISFLDLFTYFFFNHLIWFVVLPLNCLLISHSKNYTNNNKMIKKKMYIYLTSSMGTGNEDSSTILCWRFTFMHVILVHTSNRFISMELYKNWNLFFFLRLIFCCDVPCCTHAKCCLLRVGNKWTLSTFAIGLNKFYSKIT